MSDISYCREALEPLYAEGWIDSVRGIIKAGKEATVVLCEAPPSRERLLIAAKVYLPLASRGFRNDAVYQEGRVIVKARLRRAYENKTRMGQQVQHALWVDHEYETLLLLHAAGASVPKPLARAGSVILMEFIGNEHAAARPLHSVGLSAGEARPLFESVVRNVELFLGENCVHADLSPYNILYWERGVTVIDFPQAVDPRFNRNAHTLLLRDLENVCRYFGRLGVTADPARIAGRLWSAFLNGGVR